ncbi:hypothetical protein L2E82_22939 [Cichorium intybus]|uniref:Uncharacterized protein n=1 Tax=Cichorium intybus TaxID=13427 RepID=A0ACB9DZU7_CICIN|nr:hypothetical protein L2E82_22939 [Cichorium intybus]
MISQANRYAIVDVSNLHEGQIFTCSPWEICGAPIPLIFIFIVADLLSKGWEIFLTRCYLRTTSRRLRLLPTEYLLIILDEDEDDDTMLLGAQFCSDSLSSVSVDAQVSYCLHARIQCIRSLEIQGKFAW